jgi:hypothetical protein
MGTRECDMATAPVWKYASTERQQFCVWHIVYFDGCTTAVNHNRSNGTLYKQFRLCGYCDSTKWTSTECQHGILIASTGCQQSVNEFGRCILNNPSTLRPQIPRINILVAVMSKRDRNMVTAPSLKMRVNKASMILCVASCIIQGLCHGIYP